MPTTASVDEDVISRFNPATCRCESCKIRRFEPSKLKRAVVHEYSHKPAQWRKRKVANDPYDYFLGIELETDNFSTTNGTRSALVNGQAADMRRPKTFWIAKRDSSVSGPEFASHPATLTYWRSKRREVREMMEMLVHAGYRSHDNGRCGMHINISRNAIDGSAHLFRFLMLIHVNPKFSLRMSQRHADHASHWAKLNPRPSIQQDVCDSVYGRVNSLTNGYARNMGLGGTSDRYIALNAPYNEPRFEFRLPRGTLRIDRFYKNLEWTVAMIEFTRNSTVGDSKPSVFIPWVMARRAEYPYLAAFIVERGERITNVLAEESATIF